MRAIGLVGAAVMIIAATGEAAVDVRIGDVTALAGATSVSVPVYGSGSDLITALSATVRVADGGTQTDSDVNNDSGPFSLPIVSDFSSIGSVWGAAPGGFTFSTAYLDTEVAILNVALTATGEKVSGQGLLFTVNVDLTGLSQEGNSWPLYLDADYQLGGSDTTTVAAAGGLGVTGQLFAGSITILPVPEPAVMGVMAVSCVALWQRRRRTLA